MFGHYLSRFIALTCRAVFLGSHILAIGFIMNLFMPRASEATLHDTATTNLFVDVLLLLALALQYVMMKSPPDLGRWITEVDLPSSRNVTMLAASRALVGVMVFWRPLDGIVWTTEAPLITSILVGLCAVGALVAMAAFAHASHARNQCYAGCLVALWSTPTMTIGHLLAATAATIGFVGWLVGKPRSEHHRDARLAIGDAGAGRINLGSR